ncbi:MAG: protein kinase, partial [Planctomycetota bacterium]
MPSSPIDLERDRLRVIRELGTGVQGTVWLAELSHERYRLPAGHPVAVKVLRPELVADAKAFRRFHKEAEIGGRIRHPNVMRILSLEERALELDASGEGGSSGRLVYLVMEYLEGQSLREFLETRGTAVEALVRRIGREAALGLDALHRHRIVHRDIKPENLCLTRQGETKLMDLGFAARGIVRGSGSSSYGGGVRGTLSYSAPEVLRGRPVTARGDLYSLGVVLYELATGRHPFVEAREADDLIQAHLTLSPPPPSASEPRLSAFLDKLLLEMLEKEPQDRPGSAARVARIFAEGERSTFWRTRERAAPALGSERRLRRSLRPAAAGLIGRKAQLNTLERALKDASRGRCRVLHLSGPEGIGKRRLIDEFVGKRLGAGDALCYYPGEPVPRSRAQPISPLSDFLIEHYCRDLPGEGGTASGRHLREKLAVRLESEAGLAEPQARVLASYLGESPDSQHEPPIELAALALRAMGRLGRPLVLRLHRAERLAPQTLRVLEALSELEAPSPVLLLLSSHRESRPADLGRLPFEELSLPYLSEKETGALLAALFASPEEAGRACELLLAHLTPLPGLLLESLEHLVQRGELRFARGRYAELAKEAEVPVQGQLRTFLLSSWRRLSDEQRRLLEAAAILGPRFRSRDLAALLREQELDILMLLSGLRGRWVLSAEEGLRFRRRSQRQMILEEVPLPERLDLHKRAAEMFEARGAEPVSIGMQWSRGGEHAKALPCLLAAASRSLDRVNPERAESLLGRARFHLNALPRTPENLNSRMRWLGQRAEIELLRGRPRKAQEQLETALPIAGVLG